MKDAKGHGSNPRGTHAQGVEQIGNVQLHPKVLQAVKQNPGGFSVRPANGASPTSGYMVSVPGRTRIVSETDLSGPNGLKVLQQYAKEHADVLGQRDAHIGGWTDKATGKTHLDVSRNIKSKGAAIHAGKTGNQISIWDVKRKREIPTGGTGG